MLALLVPPFVSKHERCNPRNTSKAHSASEYPKLYQCMPTRRQVVLRVTGNLLCEGHQAQTDIRLRLEDPVPQLDTLEQGFSRHGYKTSLNL